MCLRSPPTPLFATNLLLPAPQHIHNALRRACQTSFSPEGSTEPQPRNDARTPPASSASSSSKHNASQLSTVLLRGHWGTRRNLCVLKRKSSWAGATTLRSRPPTLHICSEVQTVRPFGATDLRGSFPFQGLPGPRSCSGGPPLPAPRGRADQEFLDSCQGLAPGLLGRAGTQAQQPDPHLADPGSLEPS